MGVRNRMVYTICDLLSLHYAGASFKLPFLVIYVSSPFSLGILHLKVQGPSGAPFMGSEVSVF